MPRPGRARPSLPGSAAAEAATAASTARPHAQRRARSGQGRSLAAEPSAGSTPAAARPAGDMAPANARAGGDGPRPAGADDAPWLDENLPRLVEEAVREEVARAAPRDDQAKAVKSGVQSALSTGTVDMPVSRRLMTLAESFDPATHAREDLSAGRHRAAHPRCLDEGPGLQGRPARACQGASPIASSSRRRT